MFDMVCKKHNSKFTSQSGDFERFLFFDGEHWDYDFSEFVACDAVSNIGDFFEDLKEEDMCEPELVEVKNEV